MKTFYVCFSMEFNENDYEKRKTKKKHIVLVGLDGYAYWNVVKYGCLVNLWAKQMQMKMHTAERIISNCKIVLTAEKCDRGYVLAELVLSRSLTVQHYNS